MATSFDTIEDMALVRVKDYKIAKLAESSDEEPLHTYLDGFLLSAIPNFYECRQSLDYNVDARQFEATLTPLEISILADLWVIAWLDKEIQNAAQIELKLRVGTAFDHHSEAQNLKEKSALSDKQREELSLKLTQYHLQALTTEAF